MSSTSLILAGAAGAAAAYYYCCVLRKKASFKSIKVTYFPIQAVAEPIRLALTLTGTPFEDERVPFKEWQTRKPTTKYGQMPILTVDGTEYYQSGAMLRWVGANCGDGSLYPVDDPWKMYDVDEMIGLVDDLAKAWMPGLYMGMRPSTFGYPEDWPEEQKKAKVKEMREKFVSDPTLLPQYLKYFSARLAKTPFLCGEKPTIADLRLLPQLRYFQKGTADFVPKTVLDAHPYITQYITRMLALPPIKAWYAVEGH